MSSCHIMPYMGIVHCVIFSCMRHNACANCKYVPAKRTCRKAHAKCTCRTCQMAGDVTTSDTKSVVICHSEAYCSEALCRANAVAMPQRLSPLELATVFLSVNAILDNDSSSPANSAKATYIRCVGKPFDGIPNSTSGFQLRSASSMKSNLIITLLTIVA